MTLHVNRKTEKRRIGDIGEGIAVKYLENKGFSVIERNYLKPWGEIDIVARLGDTLHFVEVKTVSREPWERVGNRPEDNMHEYKLKRLSRAIRTYVLERKVGKELEWQIDLACVYLDFSSHRARVELLENIIL